MSDDVTKITPFVGLTIGEDGAIIIETNIESRLELYGLLTLTLDYVRSTLKEGYTI